MIHSLQLNLPLGGSQSWTPFKGNCGVIASPRKGKLRIMAGLSDKNKPRHRFFLQEGGAFEVLPFKGRI
jgi:hypothetical protein